MPVRNARLYYVAKPIGKRIALDEEESHHLLTVMRARKGQRVQLTDGQGAFYEAEFVEAFKQQAWLRILAKEVVPPPVTHLHLALAPPKHADRFEWFVEKATELGVNRITPLLCERSERITVRLERLRRIMVAALKQSLQAWMPLLEPPTHFSAVVRSAQESIRAVAWCGQTPRVDFRDLLRPGVHAVVLIGPEGDFTFEEISLVEAHGFIPISLGSSRLRTETAGVVVAATFKLLCSP